MSSAPERRELLLAVVLCAAGAALVLWGASATWSSFHPAGEALGVVVARSSGRALFPATAALGWAALAGALVLVAVRGWVRRAVGLLLAVAGVVVIVDAVRALVDTPPPVNGAAVLEAGALHAGHGWMVLTLVGGGLLVLAGAFSAVRGADWGGLGSSYEPPGGAPEPPVTDKGVWDALDRGDDPTA